MSSEILRTDELTKDFGGLKAVNELTVSFDDDKVYAIIGPNGAGKTTFFNLLCGVLKPSSGTVTYDGEDITNLSLREVANQGLARSYQTANLFRELTVAENVRLAAQSRHAKYNFWRDIESFSQLSDQTEELLETLDLLQSRDKTVSELSHGERRSLEIAVALGTDPELLLMDEPTSGISPEETGQITDVIEKIATELPVVVVEHKMSVVRQIADRILVLHNGEKLAEGGPGEIRENERVREVYLQEETI